KAAKPAPVKKAPKPIAKKSKPLKPIHHREPAPKPVSEEPMESFEEEIETVDLVVPPVEIHWEEESSIDDNMLPPETDSLSDDL
ncbi:MAG TPA: hypothetical protein VGO45_11325, partial [Bacteroidia bacterium]|nr:hypothetical protein [Bacteroidia bacterium]